MRASRSSPSRIKQGIVVLPGCFMLSSRCQPLTKASSVSVLCHPRIRLTARTVIGLWRPNEEMDSASSFNSVRVQRRALCL